MAGEIRQGGYRSFGQALGQYLNPEGAESGSLRLALANLASGIRDLTGTDEQSLAENQANYQASLQQVHNLGNPNIDPREKARIDSMATRWGTNMASNVGAVAPISKAVRAQNLSRFMEGSKVQEPVYHGTDAKFDVFDLEKAGRNGQALGTGFYFTNNPTVASGYGNIDSYHVNLKNPTLSSTEKTLTKNQVKDIIHQLEKEDEYLLSNYGDANSVGKLKVLNDAINDIYNNSKNDPDIITSLINLSGIPRESIMDAVINISGKDGLIAPASLASGSAEASDNIYIALKPTQIKSATGNRGTFDPNDPNILHGIGLAGSGGSRDDKKSKMSMYAK